MTKQDEIAQRAVRRSTLKSLKVKRAARIRQIREKASEEIREVNIMYAEDPERLRAKYAADDYARSERARKRAARKIAAEKKVISVESAKRKFTVGEEIFNSIVQGLGAVMAVVGTVLLILTALKKAPNTLRNYYIASYSCVGASVFFMYIMSTLHHSLTAAGAKEVFNRLTHDFVFLVLACAYTAFSLTALNGTVGWIMFGIAWAGAIVGIIFYSTFGSRLDIANLAAYFVFGWAGLTVCNQLYKVLPAVSFGMLITSGVTYTLGGVFYALRKIKYMHSIGDILMFMATSYLMASLLLML